MDGGRPARRAPRFTSPGKGSQQPQGGTCQSSLTLGPRGLAFATPWKPTIYPPGSNIPQAVARNACSGLRQQHSGSAAGSAATPHQLRVRQDQHPAEQAARGARSDAPLGRNMRFNCRTAGRPHNHPYKAGAWTVWEKCKREKGEWAREWIRDFVPRRKVREETAKVCAGGDAGLGLMWVGGSGSRARLTSDCLAVS